MGLGGVGRPPGGQDGPWRAEMSPAGFRRSLRRSGKGRVPSRRSGMGLGGVGRSPRSTEEVERFPWRSTIGQEAHRWSRRGRKVFCGGPGKVERPPQRSGRGWEAPRRSGRGWKPTPEVCYGLGRGHEVPQEVQEWSRVPQEVRDVSGVPPEVLERSRGVRRPPRGSGGVARSFRRSGRVRRPPQRSAWGREALPKV